MPQKNYYKLIDFPKNFTTSRIAYTSTKILIMLRSTLTPREGECELH